MQQTQQDPAEAQQPSPPPPDRTYRTHAELEHALRTLAKTHTPNVQLTMIGSSREGRAIFALRVSAPGERDPDKRPALLITAGIDGDHMIGCEVAVDLAHALAKQISEGMEPATSLLRENTLYILPRINPDSAERWFDGIRFDWRRNMRPVDDDRDGVEDEDAPNDLNGDGVITMMRVRDPKLADLMIDPNEPRLHLKPDRDKGERAEFALMVEGVDDDGDGAINEDNVGGVDLNRNFPHAYIEHGDGAGPYMLSEPESLALIDFVLVRPNIAVALTYGVHDNLCKVPDTKSQLASGAPRGIDERDAGLYKVIGERFQELTKLKSVPSESAGGAFFEWAYAQFGIPSFATPLWTRPDEPSGEAEMDKPGADAAPRQGGDQESAGALTPSGVGDISQETIDELEAAAVAAGFEVTDEMRAQVTPADVEQFAAMMNIKIRRVGKQNDAPAASSGGGGGGKGKAASEANKDEAAWLKYSDEQRDGAGFVPWTEVDHPKYGTVEVGGWVPYFKLNPPPGEIGTIASRQASFVLDLLARLPKVSIDEPKLTRLNDGLYEIELSMVNDGMLPTGTAMATRNRKGRPYVLRLETPLESIIAGQRVQKFWSIPGSGGREHARWIIQSADGSDVAVVMFSEKFGEIRRTITLGSVEEVGQ